MVKVVNVAHVWTRLSHNAWVANLANGFSIVMYGKTNAAITREQKN